MAFQVVARSLKINLSEMIKLAEIRHQYPDALFSLFYDYMAEPASLGWLPVPTTGPSTESVSCGIAKGSMRHTFEEKENGRHAAIQAEGFNIAATGFVKEEYQANAPEGKHGLVVFEFRTKELRCKPDPSSIHGKHPTSTESRAIHRFSFYNQGEDYQSTALKRNWKSS